MGEPMFFFAGVYDDLAAAEGDYAILKILHRSGDIGSYDAAVIRRGEGGQLEVRKSEKPTQHDACTGLAAGAASAVAFPDLLPGLVASGAAGAGLGAWFGHLAHGTSRADAEEIRALLPHGRAALIVVGIDADARRIEQTAVEARRSALKRLPNSDFAQAEREAREAMARA